LNRRHGWPVGLIFVSPAFLFIAVFMVYPVANLVWLSFHDYSPLRSAAMPWVGLGNYVHVLGNSETYRSIWASILFTVGSVSVEMILGLAGAVCFASVTLTFAGRSGATLSRLFGGLFILPFAAPTVVAAVIWKITLDPDIGPVDALIGSPIAWFSDYAMISVIIADAWKTIPFITFLLYAAIMSIEPSQFEAAKLDGANAWQEFRHLTLPSILPVMAVTAAFRTVDAFTKAFDIVFATTAGGPGDETMVFPLYIWRTAFSSLRFGEASALAIIAIVLSGVAGAGLLFFMRARPAR
jgi:ABC-type sugar transport system permease subunit